MKRRLPPHLARAVATSVVVPGQTERTGGGADRGSDQALEGSPAKADLEDDDGDPGSESEQTSIVKPGLRVGGAVTAGVDTYDYTRTIESQAAAASRNSELPI